jgi:hypothetical protein
MSFVVHPSQATRVGSLRVRCSRYPYLFRTISELYLSHNNIQVLLFCFNHEMKTYSVQTASCRLAPPGKYYSVLTLRVGESRPVTKG